MARADGLERTARLGAALVRAAGRWVPAEQRDEWLREWHAELWAYGRRLVDGETSPWMARRCLLRHALVAVAGSVRKLARVRRQSRGAFGRAGRSVAAGDLELRLDRIVPPDGDSWMSQFCQDLRFGARALAAAPGPTLIAIITLALGIGASAVMFGGVNGVVLQTLPFEQPDRLYGIFSVAPQRGFTEVSLSYPDFVDYRDGIDSFEAMAAFRAEGVNLSGAQEPERVVVVRATPELFPVLRVEASLGRLFGADEEGPAAELVAVITHGLWQRAFAGATDALGRVVRLDGEPFTVVGVLPEHYWFIGDADVYTPLFASERGEPRGARRYNAVGRLAAGVTAMQAGLELDAMAERLAAEYPESNAVFSGASLAPLTEQVMSDETRQSIWTLFTVSLFVLAMACVNVANLLLAQGAVRRREFALRAALGAGRRRLVVQQLTESALLALVGGGLGLLVCYYGLNAIAATIPPGAVPMNAIHTGPVEIGFTVAVSLATVMIFGLLPALQGVRGDLHDRFKDNARATSSGPRRLQRGLVVAQMAIASMLMIGAGLAVRSYLEVQARDPGFDAHGILTVRLSLPQASYPDEGSMRVFWDDAVERIGALPGVETAALTSSLPMARQRSSAYFRREFDPAMEASEHPWANRVVVDRGYFETMRIGLLGGRGFVASDTDSSPPVAVVSADLAERIWGDEDPIGSRLTFDVRDDNEEAVWYTVVGITQAIRNNGLHNRPWAEIFVCAAQNPVRIASLVIRGAANEPTLAAAARQAVAAVDPELPLYQLRTMDEIVAARFWGEALTTRLITACSAVALLLALVGIYGVISYTVGQRTREIGLRMALGAEARDVLRMVLRQAMRLAVIGSAIGLLGGFGLSRALRFMLYGVGANDPVTFIGVPLLLAAMALLASLLPARRATEVDPMVALRND